MLLAQSACMDVQRAMLAHCGERMRNRMAILDIWGGWKSQTDSDCFTNFRNSLDSEHLDFGAAYHPWLNTTVAQNKALLDQNLASVGGLFNTIRNDMADTLNLLPPSAAMAGIWTLVDNTRGVWKAPANVSLNSVVSPAVTVSNEEQADLNAPLQGQSINAIRAFPGQGVLVWGARTLDGNSADWRYISVRRTVIVLEESCRLALKAMVFEPNVASTWVTVKSMIENFLTGIWKQGGLAGAKADDAFAVRVGLGETMTPEDVLEGILRMTVLVAITRPGEFIDITFQQQIFAGGEGHCAACIPSLP